jgi:hypothetical protein
MLGYEPEQALVQLAGLINMLTQVLPLAQHAIQLMVGLLLRQQRAAHLVVSMDPQMWPFLFLAQELKLVMRSSLLLRVQATFPIELEQQAVH